MYPSCTDLVVLFLSQLTYAADTYAMLCPAAKMGSYSHQIIICNAHSGVLLAYIVKFDSMAMKLRLSYRPTSESSHRVARFYLLICAVFGGQ
ncbi:hypothetical protein GJV44_00506 [Candidatus Vallotia cooleyia]|nr:hypothetical protein GJV44_00506 [Candidatus Vallotia cooleyia]